MENGEAVVQLFKSVKDDKNMELITSQKLANAISIQLKIEAQGEVYGFFYKTESSDWITLRDKVDARFLSTREAGGFVGCMYALYATSMGTESVNKAHFDWFDTRISDKC